MKRNMGKIDRAIRAFVIAPATVIAAFAIGVGSVLGIILLGVAAIMLATSAVGFCPLYALLRLNSCPRRTLAQS